MLKLLALFLMVAAVAAAVSALISGGVGMVRERLSHEPSEGSKEEETED